MSVTVLLPAPDPRLQANARVHWRVRHKATQHLRSVACLCARKAMRAAGVTGFERAVLEYHFVCKTNRRRDAANFLHSQKAAIDGCVDAGLIPDDHHEILAIGAVRFSKDKDNPRVELTFTGVE